MSPPGSDLEQGLARADKRFDARRPGEPNLPCVQKTWVDICLLDANGQPVPHAAFRLTLPDGRVIEGKLDEQGLAGVDGVEEGEGELEFPELQREDLRME
ncbi:hypothetical protein JY651_27680 [Pyxidicoccus parkwayensis]|jgi:hypothetical protein|uniref:Uncharacterized protein n=1 Tax=Pyxidicoccus parkwayensis TaxID=2813578 RepID=A0ABX7NKF9_9BACT|nr:hypothetical protein [Pyxidicoccus parkwaysis]QSQ19128.1 hypothetical protein JY651_27680 [Pyxidicoccus parkwaysis]